MTSTYLIKKSSLFVALLSILLSACGGNISSVDAPTSAEPTPTPVSYSYEITVTNLTTAQPMSPVAIVLHNEGRFWQLGSQASTALEVLAESGDNTTLLAEANVLSGVSGTGVLISGASETFNITLQHTLPMMLSLATMLVNTNDAFTGVNAMKIEHLDVDESISVQTSSYDAGTEHNSELMGTIPGPAAGGEGFNEIRDDVNFVSMHKGIVSQDDGLAQSVLTQMHRFDNPTLMVTVTRTQ